MNAFTLPDSLITQLGAYEKRLRKMETLAAIAGGLAGLLAAFMALFISDRFGETPRWARGILTAGGGFLAARFAQAWARHWWWHRRGPAQLARLLQHHFRSLGDRLQGIIELTETDQLPPNLSPALLRAAIRQVADESVRFDFTRAVPVRPARRRMLAAGILVLLAATPFVFAPAAARNAFIRWIAPWSAVERYTFTSLDDLPAELVVPHGEAFEIACGIKKDSAWKPADASARLNRSEPQRARLEKGRAVFHLAGQTQKGVLIVRAGDASREVGIRPMHRPEMKELAAKVELPAYLGYPEATVPIQGGSAEFLEGSRVRFAGRTSRALRTAAMRSGGDEPSAQVQGDTFVTQPGKPEDLAGGASFRWTDSYGLTPTQPYALRVSTIKDAEPRVELQGLEPETAILPNEVLKINLAASDDYGLKEAWFGWSVRPLGKKNAVATNGETPRVPGAQTRKEVAAALDFSPAWQKIPEDSVVELAAYAVDYLPRRVPVESWKHTVYVLSPAKHADRVRDRMDQVLKQLDERIRDEERQVEETKSIAEEKQTRADADIKRVEDSERANAALLEKLTQEMQEVMKDALRNKEIPEGTIADWHQLTTQLETQAHPPMQEAAQSLQQAAQQPPERDPQLAKAQEEQQKALEAMRQAAKKMNTTNENLYAHNFYNRLRAAARAEMKVSDEMKELARATVGLKPRQIPPARQKDFTKAAGKQDEAARTVESISGDLATFLRRVPNEKYEAVEKDMRDKKAVSELTALSGFVRANLGLRSVGLARMWSEQLDEWATQLQTECNAQGGGGEIDPELMEFIVALVRTAQAEGDIREQTQIVDGKTTSAPAERSGEAAKLAEQQENLREIASLLLAKSSFNGLKPLFGLRPGSPLAGGTSKFAEFKPMLQMVHGLMAEVSDDLRKPQTDAEVTGTQGTIIELLVPPDKKGGKSGSKAQQMMRQMMAQATKGRNGGGNNSKSSSPFSGDPAAGAAVQGGVANRRNVDKAGAAANAGEWPEEFRDQLQAYFQQMEGGNQ